MSQVHLQWIELFEGAVGQMGRYRLSASIHVTSTDVVILLLLLPASDDDDATGCRRRERLTSEQIDSENLITPRWAIKRRRACLRPTISLQTPQRCRYGYTEDRRSDRSWPRHRQFSIVHSFNISMSCCYGDAEIARTDITRPDNAAPDSKGGHRETGQRETISQRWTSRDFQINKVMS